MVVFVAETVVVGVVVGVVVVVVGVVVVVVVVVVGVGVAVVGVNVVVVVRTPLDGPARPSSSHFTKISL